ncbi:MAG: hypothetical protein N3D11_02550 [Candidatus Sumerlaeia bacterium]|nr:hypothetical protein [Candidatus Sumerlaeia bacterium]
MGDETAKLIQFLSGRNDITFLYWIFAATIALILLFFFAHLIRGVFSHRIRQVEEFGMDFDAVADMIDKGLLTESEAKRVKSVLARHFERLHSRPKTPPAGKRPSPLSAEALLAAEAEALAEQTSAAGLSSGPSESKRLRPPAVPAAAPAAASAPQPSSSPAQDEPTDAVELPLDVLDMYRAGMISDDELEALRRFYAARGKSASQP